jgi:hypothetical protein
MHSPPAALPALLKLRLQHSGSTLALAKLAATDASINRLVEPVGVLFD